MESLASLILIVALISALVKLAIYHYKRLDLYKAANKLPGPHPVLPIIGNAHLFFGKLEDFISKVILLEGYNCSPIRIWLGNRLCVVLFDPQQMEVVFRSPKAIDKDEMYKVFHPFIGTGLLTAPGNKWKVHRKLIMPTFHPRILESFMGAMNEQSKILAKVMDSEVNGDEFDVFPYVSRCTLDLVCETAMGISVNVQTKRDSTYVKAVEKVMNIFCQRMIKIWFHPDIIYNFTKLAREQEECINYLHQQTNDVINLKRQKYLEKINNEDDVAQTSGPQRKAFLDLLLELSNEGNKLTNEEIREEVDTMIIAGNDTTATATTFVIYMLANFPDIQDKCYKEIVEICGDKINEESLLENKDLNQMEYLERVIKETLRLFPVAPMLFRKVNDDLEIGGGHTLPKGSTVALAVLKLHRMPDIWEDPLSFNPDRFLPEQVAKRHPYAYVPFSAGPRNCIGLKYAMISMKIILATLLRNYIFIKDKYVNIQDIEIKSEVVIKTLTPITVKIKRRYS